MREAVRVGELARESQGLKSRETSAGSLHNFGCETVDAR